MCEVEGCDRKHHAKGMCNRHYRNFMNTGSPIGSIEWGKRTYAAQHKHLSIKYGPARLHDCSWCGAQADHYALIKEWVPEDELLWEKQKSPLPRHSGWCAYSLDDAHYLTLCKTDHAKLDAGISPSWELFMNE